MTTIQDLGRSGFQERAINPGGSMDNLTPRLLNILLGNEDSLATLEIHYPTPVILFEESAIISMGGADFSAKINGKDVDSWKAFPVKTGDTLSFGSKKLGERCYLAVKGGLDVDPVLGSSSTNIQAGFGGRHIQKGDRLNTRLRNGSFFAAVEKLKISPRTVNGKLRPAFESRQELRVIAGKEIDTLDEESRNRIFSQQFIVSAHCNRMGYRLEGDSVNSRNYGEILSSSVDFGTIQLLPDGQVLILMADHQTTGGYPKIGNVIAVDLPILAQLSVGQHIHFREISIETAENVYLKQEREIRKFKAAMSLYA